MNKVILSVIGSFIVVFGLVGTPAYGNDVPQRFQKWVDLVDADTEEYPYNYTGRFNLARELALSGHREEAIAAYTQFLKDHPVNGDGLLGRATTYSWMGKYEKAENDLIKAIRHDSDYSDHWYVLGNVYYFSDRVIKALKAYNKAIEMSPNRPSFYIGRARVQLYRGKLETARDNVTKAQESGADPSRVDKWNTRIKSRRNFSSEQGVSPSGRSVTPSYTYTHLEEGRDPWRQYSVSLSRQFPEGSFLVKFNKHRRFDLYNHSAAFTVYYSDLWEGAYGNVRYLFSPEHDYLPLNDYRGALFQSIGGGWVLDANYRRLDYNASEVDLLGAGVTKYDGNWYYHLGLLRSRNKFGETGFSQSLTIRNYFSGDADDYYEFSGGLGKSTDEFGAGNVRTLESSSYGAAYVKSITSRYSFSLSYSYKDYEGQVNRESYSISLTREW